MSLQFLLSTHVPTRHPRVELWERARSRPEVASVRVAIERELGPFGYGPASLVVLFRGPHHEEVVRNTARWDVALDDWLVEQKVVALDARHEMHRTDLRLRDRFEALLRQYGDGRFNTALMRHLRRGPFAEHPKVKRLLAKIQEAVPSSEEAVALRIREVELVVARVAQELHGPLGYSEAETEAILAGALSLYLKQRFHVSILPRPPRVL